MMYHAALPQQKQLRRQLFIVAVDLADHIASIRTRGRSGRFRDLIVAIVGPLFLIDQRPLNVDSFDLPLEDIGIGADLGQLFPLEITQKAESCNAVIIAAVAIFLEADLDQTAIGAGRPAEAYIHHCAAARDASYSCTPCRGRHPWPIHTHSWGR